MSSQLQDLSNQFNSLLTEYTNTYQEFISVVNSGDKSLTAVSNFSFVGESNISVLNNSSINDCQTSCTSNSSCSGATFNNNSNSCTLSSGNGNIVFTPQSTAIVQQALYYSYKLQKINTQLTNINQQMMTSSNKSYGEFQETQQQNQQQEQALQSNYQTLTQERLEIDEMVRQFETLNAAYENGNINVTANYYSYIVLIFVAIFLVFVLLRFSLPTEQRGGGFKFNYTNFLPLFLLLGFIIVFNSFIKK
jgi:hypothetical protein